MKYQNLSYSTKTFYGVTFKPGEVKDVPGPINHTYFVPVLQSSEKSEVQPVMNQEPPKTSSSLKNKTVVKEIPKDAPAETQHTQEVKADG